MQNLISLNSAQVILILAIVQLSSWGMTFDMLGILGRIIAQDLHLANEVIFAGLTIMMLTGAIAAPRVGRYLGTIGAAPVLAIGSGLFGLGLAVLAMAHGPVTYVASWIVLGVGGAFSMTAPVYTAVVEREGANSKRSITLLMLFSGPSMTVFWPLLSFFDEWIGWRATLAVCAVFQMFVCIPLCLFALPKPIFSRGTNGSSEAIPVPFAPPERRTAFLLAAGMGMCASFITFGLLPSLLELLRQSGATPEFALQLAASCGIIGSVARIFDMMLGTRSDAFSACAAGAGMMGVSFVLLLLLPSSTATLAAFILLYGLGSGVMMIARALLPLALFSPSEFGVQSARLTLPQNLANAAAPIVFTAILDRAGSQTLLVVATALAMIVLAQLLQLLSLVRAARTRAECPC